MVTATEGGKRERLPYTIRESSGKWRGTPWLHCLAAFVWRLCAKYLVVSQGFFLSGGRQVVVASNPHPRDN